jgi:hypothetical protein
MLHTIVFAVAMLATASAGHAQSFDTSVRGQAAADLYSLRERCAAQAHRYITSQGLTERAQLWNGEYLSVDQENHYNARLNKCFMVMNYSRKLLAHNGKPTHVEFDSYLLDANERTTLGGITRRNNSIESCFVKHARCDSMATWFALLSEYMED